MRYRTSTASMKIIQYTVAQISQNSTMAARRFASSQWVWKKRSTVLQTKLFIGRSSSVDPFRPTWLLETWRDCRRGAGRLVANINYYRICALSTNCLVTGRWKEMMIQSKRPTEAGNRFQGVVHAMISVPEISTLPGWTAGGVAYRESSFPSCRTRRFDTRLQTLTLANGAGNGS